jgi:hypothetical protein
MRSAASKKQPLITPTPSGEKIDPLEINVRLYRQVSELLNQLEQGVGITMRERIAALQAIGRIQIIFLNLRKEKLGDNAYAGSAVKKYSEAFKADDAGQRKAVAGPADEPDTIDIDWDDDDDDERDTA